MRGLHLSRFISKQYIGIILFIPLWSIADSTGNSDEGLSNTTVMMALPLAVSHEQAIMNIPKPQPDQIFRLRIDAQNPGQGATGDTVNSINRRVEKLTNMRGLQGEAAFDAHLRSKPTPLVRLPDGRLMVLDKHHQLKALSQMGISESYGYIAYDLSENQNLRDPNRLSRYMRDRGWVLLQDGNGAPLSSIAELPLHIADTQSDSYRSLAEKLVKSNDIRKSRIPMAEFQWANFFRQRIPSSELLDEAGVLRPEAIDRARALSRGADARFLPGYAGEHRLLNLSTASVTTQRLGLAGTILSLVGMGADATVLSAINQNKCVPLAMKYSESFIQEIRTLDFDRAQLIANDCAQKNISLDFAKERRQIMNQGTMSVGSMRCSDDYKLTAIHKNGMTSVVQFRPDGSIESIQTHPSLRDRPRKYDLDYRKAGPNWSVKIRLKDGDHPLETVTDHIMGLSARMNCVQRGGCRGGDLIPHLAQYDELTTGQRPFGMLTNEEMRPTSESFMNARALMLYSVMQVQSFSGVCQLLGASVSNNLPTGGALGAVTSTRNSADAMVGPTRTTGAP